MEAAIRFFLEAVGNDLPQCRCNALRQLRRIFAQDRGHHLDTGGAFERRFPAEALVQHQPEAEDIATRIHHFAAHLLRRHVAGRAHHGSGRCARHPLCLVASRHGGGDLFGQPEIEYLGAPIARHHDVFGLDVAMHDPGRMRRCQCVRHLPSQFDHAALRQRATLDPLAQGFAFDELDDDVDEPILRARIVHREDVRVIQRAGGSGLLFEALAPSRISSDLRRQDL